MELSKQGTPSELPTWKEKHQPKHQLDPDRGCQQHWRCQVCYFRVFGFYHSSWHPLPASTLVRESHTSTAHKRRSEDLRSESFGARSLGHTVCASTSHQQIQNINKGRQLRYRTRTVQKQPPSQVLRRIRQNHVVSFINLSSQLGKGVARSL